MNRTELFHYRRAKAHGVKVATPQSYRTPMESFRLMFLDTTAGLPNIQYIVNKQAPLPEPVNMSPLGTWKENMERGTQIIRNRAGKGDGC